MRVAGWEWVVAFNFVPSASYLGIAYFIVRGLVSTGQLLRNYLAVATAAIFLSCAAHHLLHGLDLFTEGDVMHTSMMREMMGQSVDVAVTASTAVTGVLYLGLRRSYGIADRSAIADSARTWHGGRRMTSMPSARPSRRMSLIPGGATPGVDEVLVWCI